MDCQEGEEGDNWDVEGVGQKQSPKKELPEADSGREEEQPTREKVKNREKDGGLSGEDEEMIFERGDDEEDWWDQAKEEASGRQQEGPSGSSKAARRSIPSKNGTEAERVSNLSDW